MKHAWFLIILLHPLMADADAVVLKTVGLESDSVKINQATQDCALAVTAQDIDMKFDGWTNRASILRAERLLQDGEIDVLFGFLETPARKQNFLYLQPPLVEQRAVLMARVEDELVVESWSMLIATDPNAVIITKKDSALSKEVKNTPIRWDDTAYDYRGAVRKLLLNKGRFVYGPEAVLRDAAYSAGVTDRVKILEPEMRLVTTYLIARKNLPAQIVERLSNALKQIKMLKPDPCAFNW